MAGCMFENLEIINAPAELKTTWKEENIFVKTPIKQAIFNNDMTALRTAVKSGENVNLTDRKSNTYLHYVCTMHRPNIFHILVGCDININAQNRHGNTALHVTALHSECCHVGDLLATGIDPLIKNKDGKTAAEIKTKNLFWRNIYDKYQPGIFEAVTNHDVNKVIYLLQCWTRVDTKREGQTLRQFTASHKFHDLVFHIDFHSHTLGAIYAVLEGDANKAEKFLSHPRCNVNFLNHAAGSTHILQYALRLGDARIIHMICKANINVNIRVSVQGYLKAPLFFAAIDSKTPEGILWSVLRSNADFSLRDERGRNAAVYAIDKTKGKISIDFIEYMIKNGLDISQRDCTGVTLRDVARLARRLDLVCVIDKAYVKKIRSSDITELERMATMGYDSLLIDYNYRDTFIYASGNETEEAVDFTKWLPKFNEEVKLFHYGVQWWPVDQVKDLLKASERPDLLINSKDKGGRTALHISILHWRVDILKFLLSCENIDVNSLDNVGRSPYHYVSSVEEENEREIICQLLKKIVEIDTEIEDFRGHKASYNTIHRVQAAEWINHERKIHYGMSKQLACVDKYEELCQLIRCQKKHIKHFENAVCKFKYPVAHFSKILKPVVHNYQDLIFLAMEKKKEPIALRLIQLGTDWTLKDFCEVNESPNENDSSRLVLMSVPERATQLGMNEVLKAIHKKNLYFKNIKKTMKNSKTENAALNKIAYIRRINENQAKDNLSCDSEEVEFVLESGEKQDQRCEHNFHAINSTSGEDRTESVDRANHETEKIFF